MVRNHTGPSESDAEGADAAPGLEDDQLYRGLAATDRRRLLYSLLAQGPTTVEELATILLGWRATDTGRMLGQGNRERLLTELVHVHLPLLQDAGLVQYDDATGTVELAQLHPAVEDLLRESVSTSSAPS